MRKRILIPVLSIMLIGAVVVGSCGQAESGAPKEIKIGTVASLTGMFAGFGYGGSWGVAEAFNDINAQGGVYLSEYGARVPIKHILVNCESDITKAGTLFEDLIVNDKCDLMVGGCEPITIQIQKNNLADKYKIPHIVNGGPLEQYLSVKEGKEPPWDYVWCHSFGIATPPTEDSVFYNKPGHDIASMFKKWTDSFKDKTNKKVGVFAADDTDGIGWYQGFTSMLKEWGWTTVGTDNNETLFPIGSTDFRSIIELWKRTEVDMIIGNCPAQDFGALWKQARALGLKPKAVGAARAALFPTEVEAWGPGMANGIFAELWWHPDMDPEMCPGIGGTTSQSLYERWVEKTGHPLNAAAGWSYADGQVAIAALEKAGSIDKEDVNNAVGEISIKTLAGDINYDSKWHFAWSDLFIIQWKKQADGSVFPEPAFSELPELPVTTEVIFPMTYD